MKRSKLWLLVALVLVVTCFFAVSCEKDHAECGGLTNVTVNTEPTEATEGKVTATCACGDTLEIIVPALKDTTFWQASTTDATCTADGKTVYTSITYKEISVTVTIPKLAHTYGAWTITTEPTEETTGTAARTCTCGDVENATIAVLTDETVWTKVVDPAADHLNTGKAIFTSVYGSVEKVLDKVPHDGWSSWTITIEPTKDTTGTAERTCTCGTKDSFTLPALTDAEFWGTPVNTPSDHKTQGTDVYTNATYGSVTVTLELVPHEWSWTITTEPTMTVGGHADASCACGETDEAELPALTDTEFWGTPVNTPSDHKTQGTDVYTNATYGSVTVTLELVPHEWSWTITTEPTKDNGGHADASCACGETDEAELPALTDTEFWGTPAVTAADYNKAGAEVYTHATYGSVSVVLPKLVAPYDGKTYYVIQLGGSGQNNRELSTNKWDAATVTFDENGKGYPHGYPLQGYTEVTMVDAATGKISIMVYQTTYPEEGDPVVDMTTPKYDQPYEAYVDFATGVILFQRDQSWDNFHVMIPAETEVVRDDIAGSIWNSNAVAFTYTADGVAHSVFLLDGIITTEVTFTDAEGAAVAAETCYNAPYLFVKKGDLQIAAYGYNGTEMVVLDELYGTYTDSANAEETVKVSGYGTLTYTAGAVTMNGTYTKAPEGAAYDLDVYMVEGDKQVMYLQITLGEGKIYTKVAPEVTITFEGGDYATVAPATTNMNIAYTLPSVVPNDEKLLLVGWSDGVNIYAAGEAYVPTADVTLTAVWGEKCVITIVDAMAGDPTVAYIVAGENILSKLPAYTLNMIDTAQNRYFIGWFATVDSEEMEITDDMLLDEGFETLTITAKWKEVPAYYGEYVGGEVYSSTSGYSLSNKISIDLQGVITGYATGDMKNYNAEEKTIVLSGNTYYFDIAAGILVRRYSSDPYAKDAYVYVKGATTLENNHIGLVEIDTDEYSAAYRLIMITDGDGVTTAWLIYGTKKDQDEAIYSNVIVTDALGATFSSVAEVKASKTLVITDSEGNELYAAVSNGNNFGANNKSTPLDAVRGIYTLAGSDVTVVLDGAGNIAWGEKIGTYTVNGSICDVYFADGTEYYAMTLDAEADTCVLEKTMVDITFDANLEGLTQAPVNTNKNIAITLPVLTKEGYTFRGWYIEGAEDTILNGSYIPTETVTLIAKWDATRTFTAHYNDGTTADLNESYGEGDIITIDSPKWEGHRFIGWYTTATFEEGTEWTSGTAITEDTEIWAKWGEAFVGYGTYYGANIFNEGKDSTDTFTNQLVIDESGEVTSGRYNGTLVVDPITHIGTVGDYTCYFNAEAGIFIMGYNKKSAYCDDAYIFLRDGNVISGYSHYALMAVSSDDWGFRVFSYTLNGVEHIVAITADNAYLDVTVTDGFGAALAVKDIRNSKTIIVKQGDTILLAVATSAESFNGGSATVALDGLQGTYTVTGTEATVILDGCGGISYGDKTGTYALNGDVYEVYLTENTEYYTMTLNAENDICIMTKVMVTLTFTTGVEGVTQEPISVNKNVPTTLPVLSKEGYTFRGWMVEGTTELVAADYVATADVTLVAKWDASAVLTVVIGNGFEDITKNFGEGDDITAYLASVIPAPTAGKAFKQWLVNGEAYTGGTITGNMVVTCEWMDAVAEIGEYYVWNIYGSIAKKDNLVVDAQGNFTGALTGTFNYDENGNLVSLTRGSSTYVVTCDTRNGYTIIAHGYSNVSSLGTDFYFFLRTDKTFSSATQKTFNSSKARVVEFCFTDGTAMLVLIFEDRVYADVYAYTTDSGSEAAVAYADILNKSNLIFKYADGTLALQIVKSGSNYVKLDGTQGTHAGTLGEIVSTGSGTLTIAGGDAITYTLADGKLYFNYNNKYTVITLDAGAYTIVADGLAGEYTLPDGTTKYTLDGFGVVTGVGTYTIDGAAITVYVTGGESTSYGLDTEGKKLTGKSVFAGLTFTGTYDGSESLKFVFDDSSTISGVFYAGGSLFYFNFTGVLEGNTLTLTITTAVDTAQTNKVVVATIEGDTLTITENGITNGAYQIQGGTATCPGFSL